MPQLAPNAQVDSYSTHETCSVPSGLCQVLEHWMAQPGLQAWL
jgi:hypothetical protein